jgi:hypothetical protein
MGENTYLSVLSFVLILTTLLIKANEQMAVRILCIKTDTRYKNPYIAIDSLEWVNERINVKGITERTKLYDWIKDGDGEAYIIDQHGNKSSLIPAVCPDGNKYVKTVYDESEQDQLLALPESA